MSRSSSTESITVTAADDTGITADDAGITLSKQADMHTLCSTLCTQTEGVGAAEGCTRGHQRSEGGDGHGQAHGISTMARTLNQARVRKMSDLWNMYHVLHKWAFQCRIMSAIYGTTRDEEPGKCGRLQIWPQRSILNTTPAIGGFE